MEENCVHVNKLSQAVTDKDLETVFDKYGRIVSGMVLISGI